MPHILDKENIRTYLLEHNLIEGNQVEICELFGGFVNRLFRAKSETGDIVIKQARRASNFCPDFWAPEERIHYEATALRLICTLLGKYANVPRIIYEDKANFILVMEAAPPESVLYSEELIEGRFHFEHIPKIAKFTALLHNTTYADKTVAEAFLLNPGYQLRYLSIASALVKYPEYEQRFMAALTINEQNRICLVDLDITPKNILLCSNTFLKVDFEGSHFGDPSFDVGIVLAHYILYTFPYPQWKEQLMQCMKIYLETYQEHVTFSLTTDFLVNVKNYIALMMIGRLDAVVYFDWLQTYRKKVIKTALQLFNTPINNAADLFEALMEAQDCSLLS